MFDITTVTMMIVIVALLFLAFAVRNINKTLGHLMRVIEKRDERILALENLVEERYGSQTVSH